MSILYKSLQKMSELEEKHNEPGTAETAWALGQICGALYIDGKPPAVFGIKQCGRLSMEMVSQILQELEINYEQIQFAGSVFWIHTSPG